jgi:uncharacterized RDD family membrane protein YckC
MIVAWMVYSMLCMKRLGTTVGGRLCGLAVVRMDGGGLDGSDRRTRSLVAVLSGLCLGLGYLWALWEKDGRGWHDIMAGTRVVGVER